GNSDKLLQKSSVISRCVKGRKAPTPNGEKESGEASGDLPVQVLPLTRRSGAVRVSAVSTASPRPVGAAPRLGARAGHHDQTWMSSRARRSSPAAPHRV